jgi:hypothetical protein
MRSATGGRRHVGPVGNRKWAGNISDLEATIRMYREEYRFDTLKQLRSFAHEPTLQSAVKRASLAMRPDGKRYGHQRRLSRGVLTKMLGRLSPAKLKGSSSFHELHESVEEAIGRIRGVGKLTVYDTALRIGAKLRLKPDHVYLHSGTREGARALGLNWRAPFLHRRELPPTLRRIPAWEVEDLLCIFKDAFGRSNHLNQACDTRGTRKTRGRIC